MHHDGKWQFLESSLGPYLVDSETAERAASSACLKLSKRRCEWMERLGLLLPFYNGPRPITELWKSRPAKFAPRQEIGHVRWCIRRQGAEQSRIRIEEVVTSCSYQENRRCLTTSLLLQHLIKSVCTNVTYVYYYF
jgi:hypothetical protein